MNLVFEDLQNYRNLTACTDSIPANKKEPESFRFDTTKLVQLLQFNGVQTNLYSVEDRPDRYIFAVNGYASPDVWACHQLESAQFTTSPFDHVPGPVLDDLRAGKALMLVETLWEGFEDREIYGWWHREADRLGISRRNIGHVNGAITEERCYESWCAAVGQSPESLMIGESYFQHLTVREWFDPSQFVTFDEQIAYKRTNMGNIKLYNCLNRRPHFHREFMACKLFDHGLLPQGLVSCDTIRHFDHLIGHGISTDTIDSINNLLPLVLDDSDFNCNKAANFKREFYLDSWVSVINETLADDGNQVFLSEKIWKPVLARHPFMIWGNPKSLEIMRELGYKTFYGLLDESYDQKGYVDRAQGIIDNLVNLSDTDLMDWFERCRDICEHNYETLMKNAHTTSPAVQKLMDRYDQLGV